MNKREVEISDIYEYLEALEDFVENSTKIPATGKRIISEARILSLIQQARLGLPDWMARSKQIVTEKQQILLDTQASIEKMLEEASQKAHDIVEEAKYDAAKAVEKHEITKEAHKQANSIVTSAQNNAWSIRQGAIDYADNVLAKLEQALQEILDSIRNNREEMKN